MRPWTNWWSPRNNKDRQVLVQPPAGATCEIIGEKRYWPMSVCALGHPSVARAKQTPRQHIVIQDI
ncbi:hypothetical protein PGTUg99_003130 [Puccinia graminis f. sp. tritici]|uniref:Uncharacterized protein n=1 Tax=Puccinia graminis f. sp. tritici TaxID=56615 RepID=A0A5B0RIJ3_PUCGR|nr:hypothetical protein PGTUg99_003130 [Puccinia graminis f. sp. tritici]